MTGFTADRGYTLLELLAVMTISVTL